MISWRIQKNSYKYIFEAVFLDSPRFVFVFLFMFEFVIWKLLGFSGVRCGERLSIEQLFPVPRCKIYCTDGERLPAASKSASESFQIQI